MSTPDVRAVHEGLVREIGRSSTEQLPPITERDLGRFRAAVTGVLPGPTTPDAATPDPGLSDSRLVDPLYLTSVLQWDAGPEEGELLADGNASGTFLGLDLGGLRLMGAGQQITLHRAVPIGVPLLRRSELVSARYREGSTGPLVIIEIRRSYSSADADSAEGAPILESVDTFLGR